jgi:hypothetical protein
MDCKIPQPLQLEHEELHTELVKATQAAGKLGEAARAVAQILPPHFVKEEEYALPPQPLLLLLERLLVLQRTGPGALVQTAQAPLSPALST